MSLHEASALQGIRLYLATVDSNGRHHSEGPYKFPVVGDALAWLAKQTDREVLGARLYDGTELLAKVGDDV